MHFVGSLADIAHRLRTPQLVPCDYDLFLHGQGKGFSDPYREYAGYASPDKTVRLPVDLQFIEDSVYPRFIEALDLPIEEYMGQDAKIIAVAKKKPDEQVGQSQPYDMFPGPSMTLRVASRGEDKSVVEHEQDICVTLVNTILVDTLPRLSSEVKPFVFMAVAPIV